MRMEKRREEMFEKYFQGTINKAIQQLNVKNEGKGK